MIQHYDTYSMDSATIKVTMTSNWSERFKKAQYWLDNEIMVDMLPYMPLRTGVFRNRTLAQSQAMAGSGYILAAAGPYGRFLYMGKVMVDPVTGSPWARRGVKKVVTDRDLTFIQPNARPKWFEVAKAVNMDHWSDGVAKILSGA